MKVQVYDPAMCCPTGVCGPAVDPVLPKFAADLDWLKGQGVDVERYNLSQEPAAFASSELVKQLLAERGTDCLPLVLVDGRVVADGQYPQRSTLAALTGLPYTPEAAPKAPKAPKADACCTPKAAATGPADGAGAVATDAGAKCC